MPERSVKPAGQASRRNAVEIISQALSPTGHAFAQDLLAERLGAAEMNDADRRLTTELTYGVIRRLATLDAVLAAYSSRPLDDLDPAVRQILRVGAYQLLFMERVPAHAAVDESVRLCRATGKLKATGFVNAVLRGIAREVKFSEQADPEHPRESFDLRAGRACAFPKPILPPPAQFAEHLAARLSFPAVLIRRWLKRYGPEETTRLCSVSNEPPPIFVRPNLMKTTPAKLAEALAAEKAEATPSPSGRTLRLPPHARPESLASFRDGLCTVQDDSSAAVAPMLDPKPGQRVLDLCAAPGGKSVHCAELMQGQGVIVAVDTSLKRLGMMQENLVRLGHAIVGRVEADGADFARQHPAAFDRVLLDAPCTNTGVLRRRVEARWRFSESALAERCRLQRNLLDPALSAVKPGGALVYSVCSLEPEEGSELIAACLRGRTHFRLETEQQFTPTADGGDGMYMARVGRSI